MYIGAYLEILSAKLLGFFEKKIKPNDTNLKMDRRDEKGNDVYLTWKPTNEI